MDEGWKITYYQTSSEKSPVYDFIQGLNPKAKSKIIAAINLLEEYGVQLSFTHTKKLTGTDLWELRVVGGDNIRIFYVAFTGKSFLLLHGFVKKTQKTEKKEIKTARERLKDYKLRLQNEL